MACGRGIRVADLVSPTSGRCVCDLLWVNSVKGSEVQMGTLTGRGGQVALF